MAAALLSLQRITRTLTPLTALARSYYVRPVVPSPLSPATHRIGFGPHSVAAPTVKEPADFLKRIGRDAETKLSVESWEELWRMDGAAMKKAGVGIRDRRCVVRHFGAVVVAGLPLGPVVGPGAGTATLVCALHSALLTNGWLCRYIQWCMEKFRLGFPIEEFAHEPTPKKTIRGCVVCFVFLLHGS